jgi:hypothetical protein
MILSIAFRRRLQEMRSILKGHKAKRNLIRPSNISGGG